MLVGRLASNEASSNGMPFSSCCVLVHLLGVTNEYHLNLMRVYIHFLRLNTASHHFFCLLHVSDTNSAFLRVFADSRSQLMSHHCQSYAGEGLHLL
jgi:hypothetical protein